MPCEGYRANDPFMAGQGLRPGLKGNQWLISSDHRLFFWGGRLTIRHLRTSAPIICPSKKTTRSTSTEKTYTGKYFLGKPKALGGSSQDS